MDNEDLIEANTASNDKANAPTTYTSREPTDTSLRLSALDFAMRGNPPDAVTAVKAAKEFYAFLTGAK